MTLSLTSSRWSERQSVQYAQAAARRAFEQYGYQERPALPSRHRRLYGVSQFGLRYALQRLYNALPDALIASGDFRSASAACAAEVQYRKDDAVGLGKALLQRAKIQARLETCSRALWWLTRARTVLARAEDREAKRVSAGAAAYYAAALMRLGGRGEPEMARVAASEAQACGDKAALAEAYDVMDMVNFVSGEPAGSCWTRRSRSRGIGRFRRAGTDPANQGVGLQAKADSRMPWPPTRSRRMWYR